MKKIIKEMLLIFGACFIYANIYFMGPFDKQFLPVLLAMFYGTICSIIYVFSLKLIKSERIFFFLSWMAIIILIIIGLEGADKAGLNLRRFNLTIYQHGEITLLGMLYKFFNPVGVMALISTGLLVLKFNKNKGE